MKQLVECVPNFSEGRDRKRIDAIAAAIDAVEGVSLLDVDPGADTNRTVVTFVGEPASVQEAAFRGIQRAAELIDMRAHQGAHARQGATDVCPFVPVAGVTMEECAELARALGARVAGELGIPVYLYEHAASSAARRNLADVRAGEYEGLAAKLDDPAWRPDFGEPRFNAKSGATAVGAREFLVAYNVNLNTPSRKKAHDIALDVRERGRLKRDGDGRIVRSADGSAQRVPGALKEAKAVGWYIDEYKQAQVSMNLTNFHVTPIHAAFEAVRSGAQKRGMRVTGSEIVGLVPLEAILTAGRYYLERQGLSTGIPEDDIIRVAVQSMGLDDVAPFDPAQKIIERRVQPPLPLVTSTVRAFADELSTDSPAPGGGSVAALCGALGASLAAMVANLTVGRKGHEAHWAPLGVAACQAQALKDELLAAIDLDTEAFNGVMGAMRQPAKTESAKAAKAAAVQAATREAIRVPLEVVRAAGEVVALADQVARQGNPNSLSDAGVAALAARAAARGAHYNVLINLKDVTDPAWAQDTAQRSESLVEACERQAQAVLDTVEGAVAVGS